LDQAFNILQVSPLGRITERERSPAGAGPGRPPDAVDITFRHVGKLEVDDMGYPFHIDAPGRDIRRHQDTRLAVAEPFERALPRTLGLIAMNGFRGNSAFAKLLGDSVGAVLGAREHDHLGQGRIIHNAGQQGNFALGVDVEDTLFDAFMDFGREEVAKKSLDNVSFENSDALVVPFEPEYDFVFSRFGTMFFSNPVAAMRNMRRP